MTEIELFDKLNPRRDLSQATCDVISRVYEVISKEPHNVVWHDLDKDATDLPVTEGEYLFAIRPYNNVQILHFNTQSMNLVKYIRAWRELPKFEEDRDERKN